MQIEFYSMQTSLKRTFASKTDITPIFDYLNDKPFIGVDTETTGYSAHSDKVLSLQLGDKEKAFVIDISTIPLVEFKPLFKQADKTFLFQNAQFDLRFLYNVGIEINNVYDTLLAECIIMGGYGDKDDIKSVEEILGTPIANNLVGRSLTLDALAMKYLNVTLDKSVRGVIHREGLTDRVIEYGAKDVLYLLQIREKQLEVLKEYKDKYDLGLEVLELENKVVKVFSKMALNGVKLNVDKYRTEVIKTAKQEVNNSIKVLDNVIHNDDRFKDFRIYQGNLFFDTRTTEINWNSYSQKLKLLKLINPSIESTGSPVIRKEIKHPLGVALLSYNKYKKLQDAFGDKFISHLNKDTLRMHPSIWQILSTGRISMKDPNLLQIPARGALGSTIRSCFIADKGNKIVGGDYSGFELRIIAEYSQDPLWVNTFKNGGDLHSILCSETFDIPLSDVKKPFPYNKNVTYRDVQKTLNFGLSYGMSEFKLSSTIGVSVKQAQDIIKKFFSKVPDVEKFLNKIGNLGTKRGYIKVPNPYGRIRFFPKYNVIKQYPGDTSSVKKKWLGEIERASKNTPIQGVNGTVIKLALILVQEEIDKHNYPVKILLSVYDEIQTECRDDFVEEWKVILENKMIEAGKIMVKTVPIVAECDYADYWVK